MITTFHSTFLPDLKAYTSIGVLGSEHRLIQDAMGQAFGSALQESTRYAGLLLGMGLSRFCLGQLSVSVPV